MKKLLLSMILAFSFFSASTMSPNTEFLCNCVWTPETCTDMIMSFDRNGAYKVRLIGSIQNDKSIGNWKIEDDTMHIWFNSSEKTSMKIISITQNEMILLSNSGNGPIKYYASR